nr:PepSY domain-containing protein [Cereibacter changlensis]
MVMLRAGSALAGDDCEVPMDRWRTREAVFTMAEGQGWTIRRVKIDDGCYEIRGADAQGRAFKVKIDPETLEIVEQEFDDDDDKGHERRRHSGSD